MSENSNNRVCPSCGAEQTSQLAMFCSSCGALLGMTSRKPVGEPADTSSEIQNTDTREEAVTTADESQNEDACKDAPIPDETEVPKAEEQPSSVKENTRPIVEEPRVDIRKEVPVTAEPVTVSAQKNEASVLMKGTAPQKAPEAHPHHSDEAVVEDTVSHAKNFMRRNHGLICSLILFAAAVILALLALFPVAYSVIEVNERDEIRMDYDSLDVVELTVASFFAYSDKQISSTPLYKQHTKDMEGVNFNKLSKYDEAELSELMKDELQLELMRSATPIRISMIVAAVVTVLYLLLCALLAFTALIAFFGALARTLQGKHRDGKMQRAATRLLWLTTAMIPLFIYVLIQFTYFGIGRLAMFSSLGGGVSNTLVVSLAVALIASVLICILCFVEQKRVNEGHVDKKTGKGIVALVLIPIMLATSFMPALKLSFAANGNKSVEYGEIYVSSSEIHELTSLDLKTLVSLKSSEAKLVIAETSAEIVDGELDEAVTGFDLLNLVIVSCGRTNVTVFYIVKLVLEALAMLFAALTFSAISRSTFLQKSGRRISGAFKIVTLILALANLVITVVLAIIAKLAISNDIASYVKVGVSFAPVLLVILAIVVIIVDKDRSIEEVRSDFDNPDVSYVSYLKLK